MIKIVTDSLSDIPAPLARELGVSVVPLLVYFGSDEYRDGVDISTDEFYRRLESEAALPRTSAPGAGVFIKLFQELTRDADGVLAIMASSRVSAIYNSAVQAKNALKGQVSARIEVVDSLEVLAGEMFLVLEAVEAVQSGADMDEVLRRVSELRPRVHIRAAFDTLEYLKKGGRIGRAQAFVGTLLHITPILGFKDGEAYPCARVRSYARAKDYLVEFVRSFSSIKRLAVEDATTPYEADALADRLGTVYPRDKIVRAKFSPVVGTHVGPHVIAVSVLEG